MGLSDIVREFDSNFYIPEELKNATHREPDTEDADAVDEEELDIQWEYSEEEASELDDSSVEEALEAPDFIDIVSQTIRTSPSGGQVVDVIIDIPDSNGQVKYEVRVTKNDY